DGVELVGAVGDRERVGAGAGLGVGAGGGSLVGDADAVEGAVAAEAEVERAVLGDRRRVGAAGVGQVGEGQSPGDRRGVVDHDRDGVAGRGVGGRIGDDGVELVGAV